MQTLKVIALVALFIAPLFLMPVPASRRWVVLFIGFVAVLAACEAVTWWMAKATLSELFWRWSETHQIAAWVILACLAAGWALVLFHLARKLIPGGK